MKQAICFSIGFYQVINIFEAGIFVEFAMRCISG